MGREREHTAVLKATTLLLPSSILHSESTRTPLLVFMRIFTRVYERCLKGGGGGESIQLCSRGRLFVFLLPYCTRVNTYTIASVHEDIYSCL